MMPLTPARTPASKSPLAKRRHNSVVDDLRRHRIGEITFETIAHFDANLVFGRGDDQYCAVIVLLAADPPLPAELVAVIRDRNAAEVRNRHHYDLLACCALVRFESCGQVGALVEAQNSGRIDDATGQRRKIRCRNGRRMRADASQQRRVRAHQNLTVGAVVAPSFASNDSRTFMSLYMIRVPDAPGNVRSSVLYCCTARDVITPRDADAVLGAFELRLQLQEVLVGLQVRDIARRPP